MPIGLAALLALSGPPFQDVAKWNLVCYCDAVVATPHAVVRTGNNGVILYALRDGGTIDGLRKAGLIVTQSQLSLLSDWQLIGRNGDVYTTTMPLIDDATLGALDGVAGPIAVDFVRAHASAIRTLVGAIDAAGLTQQQYAVLFSYVFDGQVWRSLDADRQLPPTKPDLRHPFWNGAFWAVQANRLVPGTNTESASGITTYRTWNDNVAGAVNAYRTAQFALPSFADRAGVPIHDDGKALADALAAIIEEAASASTFPALRSSSKPVVALILGHEIVWAVMEQIVAEGLVEEPAVLRNPKASTEEIGALIFRTTP